MFAVYCPQTSLDRTTSSGFAAPGNPQRDSCPVCSENNAPRCCCQSEAFSQFSNTVCMVKWLRASLTQRNWQKKNQNRTQVHNLITGDSVIRDVSNYLMEHPSIKMHTTRMLLCPLWPSPFIHLLLAPLLHSGSRWVLEPIPAVSGQ